MNNKIVWVLIVVIVVAVAGIIWWSFMPPSGGPSGTNGSDTNSGTAQTPGTTQLQSLTLAAGELKIMYDPTQFALAAAPEPVLAQAYIPPCDQGFDYCFYAPSGTYAGTNFESAGLAVKHRTDLKTENACLNTAPAGYTMKPSVTSSQDLYAVSGFKNIGGGAAGHVASGDDYRLFVRGTSNCYDFTTRVGMSQFANYPSGTIQQFTAADEARVMGFITNVLNSTQFATSGQAVNWPRL